MMLSGVVGGVLSMTVVVCAEAWRPGLPLIPGSAPSPLPDAEAATEATGPLLQVLVLLAAVDIPRLELSVGLLIPDLDICGYC